MCLEIARVNKHESRRETGGRGRDSTAWLCRAKVWEGERERRERRPPGLLTLRTGWCS